MLKVQSSKSEDTICALATAPGGALGVIRVSGPQSLEILSHVFTKNLAQAQPNTIHYGHIKDGPEIIDEVLVSIFRAPYSYTGEDSAEISCHGSRYILNKVLELLIQNGCRMANPGEYTQRAFLHKLRPWPTSSHPATKPPTSWPCRNYEEESATS